jgi:membrane protein
MVFRTAKKLISGTFNAWLDGDVSKFAASLAFYTIFSLGPTLMILLAIVGALYGEETARRGIVDRFQWLIGSSGVQTIVIALDAARASSAAVTLAGVLGLVFGATAVFVNLQDALNSIWGVAPKPGWQVWPFFRKRLLSFVMILGLGLVLILSFLISTLIAALREFASNSPLPGVGQPLAIADFVLWIGILTLAFGITYKVLPDVKTAWTDVWIGAVVAAVLFTLGRTLIGVYLARSSAATPFGAAGSLVIFLLWIYYSAQIFLLCGEFTQVYARHRGPGIQPDDNAVRVVKTYVNAKPRDVSAVSQPHTFLYERRSKPRTESRRI